MRKPISIWVLVAAISCAGCGESAVSGAAAPTDAGDVGHPEDAASPDGAADTQPDAPADEVGPTIEILSPKGGVALAGAVLVHVVAADPSGVELLRVAAGADLLPDTNPLPDVFLGTWDSVAAGDGEHLLTVEARDAAGNTTWQEAPVLVKNGPGRLVTGTVSTGAPLEGAAVVLRDWNDGLGGGAVLGSAVTDAAGRFDVTTLIAAPSGWGIVEVRGPGGTATDPATGARKTLTSDDALAAIVRLDDDLGAVVTRVNAWTTLSAGLAAGLRKAGTDRDTAPGKADAWIAEHLQRPKPFDLHVEGVVAPADPAFAWPSAGAVLGLTHIALGRVAAERGGDVLDAARVLAADLWDTKFDGKGAVGGGQSGLLAWPDETPVDIEDTRYTLALELAAWAGEPGAAVSLPTLDEPDGLLDTLADDDGPLYPAGAPAFPHDEDPPEVSFLAPTPPEGAWVTGDGLPVTAVAKDKTPLQWFTLTTEPPSAAAATVDGGVLTATIDLKAVADGALTLRAAAQDTSKHALEGEATRTVNVDRTAPLIVGAATTPAPGAIVATDMVQVAVVVHDATSGVTQVRVLEPACGACPPVDLAPAGGDVWEGTVPLPNEGPTQLEIEARDAAGNTSDLPYTLNRDTAPPTIAAVKSEYVDAATLELTVGTTEETPVWAEATDAVVQLTETCCLSGGACEPGVCTDEVRVLATEQECNPRTPTFRFIASDAGGLIAKVDFELAVKDGVPESWKTVGTWSATIANSSYWVRLCTEVLGVPLSDLAGKPLELRVRAVDTAGNHSPDIVIQPTISLVSPPLWIEKQPLTGAADELQTYSLSNLSAHFPYGVEAPQGANPNGYLAAAWHVINPHALDQTGKILAVAQYFMLRAERRSYLPIGPATPSCSAGKCSYLWTDGEFAETAFASGCTTAIIPTVDETPIPISSKTTAATGPGGQPQALVPGEALAVPLHSTTRIEVRVQTQGTCALPPPVLHQGPGAASSVFYPVPAPSATCSAQTPALPVVPKAFTSGAAVSSCTVSAQKAWDYYNPAVIAGVTLVPKWGFGFVAFGFDHSSEGAVARLSAAPILADLLEGWGQFPNNVLPKASPF